MSYALLQVKVYLSDIFTAPLSTFALLKGHEDLDFLAIKLQEQIDMDNLYDEVHTSDSSFNPEERYVFKEIVGAILPSVASYNAIYALHSTSANPL